LAARAHQKLVFADGHAVVAQDGVSRGDVEKHIGQRPIFQVVLAAHGARGGLTGGEGDMLVFQAVEGGRRHGLQPGQCLVNAAHQRFKRFFGVFIYRRFQPRDARGPQLAGVAGNRNLPFEGQHVRRQPELHQRLFVIAARLHIGLRLGQQVAQITQELGKNGQAGGRKRDGHEAGS